MMDRICNSILSLGDPSHVELYPDYSQWEASVKKKLAPPKAPSKKQEQKDSLSKLTYMEKKEYDAIEGKIAKLEESARLLIHQMEQAEIATNPEALSKVCADIGLIEMQIEQLYLRWEELGQKKD